MWWKKNISWLFINGIVLLVSAGQTGHELIAEILKKAELVVAPSL